MNRLLAAQIIRRILASGVTLVGLSIIVFSLVQILPGDYADVSAGRISSFEQVDRQRADYDLDQSIPVRYWRWFSLALRGEFGNAWWTGTAIGPLIWERLGHTAWLALIAATIALPLGTALGLISAIYAGRGFDRLTSTGVLAVLSIPEWFLAYMFMYLFAVKLGWFPAHEFFSDELTVFERLHATLLPALSLAALGVAPVLRLTRACIINTFRSGYIELAQLKGLSVWRIVWRHALPNAISPICNIVVLALANLLVGVVIVESIFSYPGFGHAFLMAAKVRDLPLAMACGLVSGMLYLALNLCADLVSLFSNPRLRYPSSASTIATPIVPRSVSQAFARPRVKFATALGALVVILIGYAYLQLTATDDVTHDNIHPPFGFRTALNNADLLTPTGEDLRPVHFDNFLPVGKYGPANDRFEGSLSIAPFDLLGRPSSHRKRAPGYVTMPGFEARFLTVDDRLIAVEGAKMLNTSSEHWLVILDDGRVWAEPGDGPQWSRASFPFTLVDNRSRYAFNAVATFLYNAHQTSQMRVQIAQESTPDGEKYDYWGQTTVRRVRHKLGNRAEVIAAAEEIRQHRLDVRPWEELAARYGADVAGFTGELASKYVTVAGLYVDDTVYVQPCLTRFGPHPYCRSLRASVYSMTKTLGGTLSMLHLAQLFGPGVFDERLLDYIRLGADHDGWRDVTFGDLVDMSSGVGNEKPERVDEYVDVTNTVFSARFFKAPSAADKLEVIASLNDYPWGPNEVFRYQDSDYFSLAAGLDTYLKVHLGANADLWDTLTENVFLPLGIGPVPVLRSREPDGTPGIPLFESGVYPTFEQTLKLARLIRDHGRYDGRQLLHRGLSEQAANHAAERGLPTGWRAHNGVETNYEMGLWLTPILDYEACPGRIPFMSGYGGSYVGLMPNGMIAFRFADGWSDDPGTWDTAGLQTVANNIKPFCAAD